MDDNPHRRTWASRCFETLGRCVFMYFMAFVGMVLASGTYNPYMTVGGGLLGLAASVVLLFAADQRAKP